MTLIDAPTKAQRRADAVAPALGEATAEHIRATVRSILPETDDAPIDPRRQARRMYWFGWPIKAIAEDMGLARTTVQSWKDRDGWDNDPAIKRAEEGTLERYLLLIAKPDKSGKDFKEIDLLGRQIERLARVRRYSEPGGHEGDLNPKISERAKAARAVQETKQTKNHFTTEQAEKLIALFEDSLYHYQSGWWAARDQRTRMILKSRQIGATWYFAREALVMAITTGHNQIFLSGSKSQAHIFRTYMVDFAAQVGVKLTGEVIHVTSELVEDAPPAELHFLGTNYKTAQGYHGDFYMDEFFWVHGFAQLNKVAAAMATHKHWRKTYFSTPSSVAHEAYDFWTGARINKGKPKAQQITIDVGHGALAAGRLCEDGIWRQIVTVEDAEAGGCDLFDIEELKRDNAEGDYANLYQCQFVDDSQSAFKFSELLASMSDTWLKWHKWFSPLTARPAGQLTVWAGYDPQEAADGDNAALVIALPPSGPNDKFRLLEKWQLRGDFAEQDAFIKSVFAKYNVTYFGLDATGVGAGVYQLVAKWFPTVTKIEYSLEVKARMVMKAQNLFRTGRVEFDFGWVDLTQAFIAIKRTLTRGGGNLTFKAGRGGAAGHADLAWATMHIFDNEPLDGSPRQTGRVMIFGDSTNDH